MGCVNLKVSLGRVQWTPKLRRLETAIEDALYDGDLDVTIHADESELEAVIRTVRERLLAKPSLRKMLAGLEGDELHDSFVLLNRAALPVALSMHESIAQARELRAMPAASSAGH